MLRSSSRNAASSGVSASCMAASCRVGVTVATHHPEPISGDAGRSLNLHLDPSPAGAVHSLGLIHRSAPRRPAPGRLRRRADLRSAHANRTSGRAPAAAAPRRTGCRCGRRGFRDDVGRGLRERRPELAAAALAARRVRRSGLGGEGARRPGTRGRHRAGDRGGAGGAGHGVHVGARPAGAGDVGQAAAGREGGDGEPALLGEPPPNRTTRWWSASSAWCTPLGW